MIAALLLLAVAAPQQAVQDLQAALLSHDSATLTLDDWCHAHAMLPPDGKLVAERVTGADKPATAEIRRRLAVSIDEPLRYRRVRLRCGTIVMSEADNWYVPSRLTPAMNVALDGSDVPFGRVVQPLHFHRTTLSARLLWPAPGPVIENSGLLTTTGGVPFSLVVETYQRGVLAFGPAAAPKISPPRE